MKKSKHGGTVGQKVGCENENTGIPTSGRGEMTLVLAEAFTLRV